MKIEKYFSIRLNQTAWKFDITIAGQRIRRGEFPTKREAEEVIAALRSRARSMRFGLVVEPPGVTLGELYEKRKADPLAKARRQLITTLDFFLESVDPKTPIVDLKKSDLKNFLVKCEEKGLKDSTINRYLSTVSGTLRAVPDYFPELEEWEPPRFPWKPESPGRGRLLSADETTKLITAMRDDRQYLERFKSLDVRREIYDLFRLMILTGAREGELLKLRQVSISWDWKTVNLDATKTKTNRLIPLSDLALDILRSRQANAPRVFKAITTNQLYTAVQRASEVAGIAYGDRTPGGWVLYDLRHLAATVMENGGTPYSSVSAILGHKRSDQTATYTHAMMETMRRGVETLEAWCREIDGFEKDFAGISRTPQRVHRKRA